MQWLKAMHLNTTIYSELCYRTGIVIQVPSACVFLLHLAVDLKYEVSLLIIATLTKLSRSC